MIMNQFKKCKIVMLSTNEKSNLFISPLTNRLYYTSNLVDDKIEKPQHLYITLDEEIKKDDWMYSKMDGYPTQWDGDLSETKNPREYGYNKIIVSTNNDLELPKPSIQFIEKYIEEYNRGRQIVDIMVEYEEYK